jgi:hypothetical protein
LLFLPGSSGNNPEVKQRKIANSNKDILRGDAQADISNEASHIERIAHIAVRAGGDEFFLLDQVAGRDGVDNLADNNKYAADKQ